MTTQATKITKNIFCYHLIGFDKNIIYDTKNRNLILSCSVTGAPLEFMNKDEDLDFKSFILVAQNIFMSIIDSFD